jgi:hypothetical protein
MARLSTFTPAPEWSLGEPKEPTVRNAEAVVEILSDGGAEDVRGLGDIALIQLE